MSRVTQVYGQCRTRISHGTHMNASCHTYDVNLSCVTHKCHVTHVHVQHLQRCWCTPIPFSSARRPAHFGRSHFLRVETSACAVVWGVRQAEGPQSRSFSLQSMQIFFPPRANHGQGNGTHGSLFKRSSNFAKLFCKRDLNMYGA